MEYDLEARVLSALLATRDMEKILDNRITDDYFQNAAYRQAFRFIVRFWRDYGKVPDLSTVQEEVPVLEVVPTPEPFDYYLSELRNRQKYMAIIKTLNASYQDLKVRGWEAVPTIERALSELSAQIQEFRLSQDKDVHADAKARLERYEARKQAGGVVGIPSPWAKMNAATGGWRPGQLVTVMGESGIGKTFFLLLLAIAAEDHGEKPLFISREMEVEELEDRYDALRYQLSFPALMAGQLPADQEEIYRTKVMEQASKPGWVISADDERGYGISAIQAKVERYQPSILFVDGGYLLDDEQGGKSIWERQTHITRGLKRLARNMNIPVVVATQANREGYDRRRGPTKATAAYSLSWIQDSDVVIALYQNKNMALENKMELRLIKVRNGPTGVRILINWNLSQMDFSEVQQDEPEIDADVLSGVLDEEDGSEDVDDDFDDV